MKENGNTLKKSTSKLKSSRKMEIINVSIFKESEIVAKAILEKIISMVISTMFDKTIESQISSLCLSEMKKNIDNIIDLQFINHDKDDLNKKKINKNNSQKIILRKDTENNNISLLTEEKAMNKESIKSKIRKALYSNNTGDDTAGYYGDINKDHVTSIINTMNAIASE